MIVVAIAGATLGVVRETTRLGRQAEDYARRANIQRTEAGMARREAVYYDEQEARYRATATDARGRDHARWAAEMAAWHRRHIERSERLAGLYERAAKRPWVAVPPEPPEPEAPDPPR